MIAIPHNCEVFVAPALRCVVTRESSFIWFCVQRMAKSVTPIKSGDARFANSGFAGIGLKAEGRQGRSEK
jgi:hypothetical protein